MYMDPTKLLPNWVAKLIRCDSPPDGVAEFLLNLNDQDLPRLKDNLLISISNLFAICFFHKIYSSFLKKSNQVFYW
jgi:hypothetical protein